MPKYVIPPPAGDLEQAWAERLRREFRECEIGVAGDETAAARELADADGGHSVNIGRGMTTSLDDLVEAL